MKTRRGAALLILLTAAGPAVGQEDFRWTYNRSVDADPFKSLFVLAYGIPDSDAVQFQATCEIGAGGTYVRLDVAMDVAGLANDTPLDVYFTGQGFSEMQSGVVVGVDAEVGITGAELRVEVDDPLWPALGSLTEMQYYVAGRAPQRLALGEAAGPAAGFISDCRTMPGPNVADGIRRPGGGALPPGGGQVATARPRLECDALGTLRTETTGPATTVTFINDADGYRSVFWLDPEGVPKPYANLNPGESYVQQTYVGHPWMITDGPGNCLAMYMPVAGGSEFRITGSAPGSGGD